MAQGNLPAAEMEHKITTEKIPDFAEGFFCLANVHRLMRKYDDCFKNYQIAIKLNPNNKMYHNNIGLAYY